MKIYDGTLVENSVSIISDEYGTRAYVNSVRGRAQLQSECPAEIVQEVYKMWGDTPTVTECAYPHIPQNAEPTVEDRLSATESAIIALMGGTM